MPDSNIKPQDVQKSRSKGWPLVAKLYAVFAVLVLLATSAVWANAGAQIHQSNADQLVSPYLFEDAKTFEGAQFPGQHTFLLKWPFFALFNLVGFSADAFIVATVLTVLATVGLLAWFLYRLVRQPYIFGTVCLAAASILLLVPAQPHPGGILPVNMAMLTTRNLEYIAYIFGLWLIIRTPGLTNWRFWLGVVLIGVLIASDKLFLPLGIGSAALLVAMYACFRHWQIVKIGARSLLAMVLATGFSMALLAGINYAGFTHIVGDSNVSPYGFVSSFKDVLIGTVHGVLGLLTNFGANPAPDYRLFEDIPAQLSANLLSVSGPSFVVNLLLMVVMLLAAAWVIRKSFTRSAASNLPVAQIALVLLLFLSAAVAFGVFVATKHYYPVDARYLTIALFAGVVALAVFLAWRNKPEAKATWLIGGILLVSIGLGLPYVASTYSSEKSALTTIDHRNDTVAHILKQRSINVLVGNYWRVMPIKQISSGGLTATPLADCTNPSQVLTSTAWQPDLSKENFAYLLQLDPNLTSSPNCSVEQVVSYYGHPNATVVVDGSADHPKELLLVYNNGANKSAPNPPAPSTVDPLTADQIPHTSCPTSTVMSIVAHEDDDLLFMNPDLMNTFPQGKCVRAVYVTSGDAGSGTAYWHGRQEGSKAAYALMSGSNDVWVEHTVKLSDKHFVAVVTPRDNPKISLIFMHLPDGNLQGQGFDATSHESIGKTEGGAERVIDTVDGQSQYTASQLVDALAMLMAVYKPDELRTQSSHRGTDFVDHSDHHTVSLLTKAAHQQHQAQANRQLPIVFYLGYPVRDLPENVTGEVLEQKLRIFLTYGAHDKAVCQSEVACKKDGAYGGYLRHQYKVGD